MHPSTFTRWALLRRRDQYFELEAPFAQFLLEANPEERKKRLVPGRPLTIEQLLVFRP